MNFLKNKQILVMDKYNRIPHPVHFPNMIWKRQMNANNVFNTIQSDGSMDKLFPADFHKT